MTVAWEAVLYVLGAYLLGSVPTGYLIAKKLKGIDIREHGSRNVGATNVGRVVGKNAGIATLILDFLKGFLPVFLGRVLLFPHDPLIHLLTAVAVVVGHSRSVFLNFTGGKSAISGLGGLLAMDPVAGLAVGAVSAIVTFTTRYVSVGSICASIAAPVAMLVRGAPAEYVTYALFAALYVVFRHRENIRRLLRGQENKLS